MSINTIKKQAEMLKVMFLEGYSLTRENFAIRLGLSNSSFDKTFKALSDAMEAVGRERSGKKADYVLEAGTTTNYLAILYRMMPLRHSELVRLLLTILLFSEADNEEGLDCNKYFELMYTELEKMYECKNKSEPDQLIEVENSRLNKFDLKTAQLYLNRFCEWGMLAKKGKSKNIFKLNKPFYEKMNVLALTALVQGMSSIADKAAMGILLYDKLVKKLAFERRIDIAKLISVTHVQRSRVLYELTVNEVCETIEKGVMIEFEYYGKALSLNYQAHARNSKETKSAKNIPVERVYPLVNIFDRQFGRWYMIAIDENFVRFKRYRIENMGEIIHRVDNGRTYNKLYEEKKAEIERKLKFAWLVEFSVPPVCVQVKFYNPMVNSSGKNYIYDRVIREQRWGEVTQVCQEWFLWEIKVNGVYEIMPWLRSFGQWAKVLAPQKLRRKMEAEWQKVVELYEEIEKN